MADYKTISLRLGKKDQDLLSWEKRVDFYMFSHYVKIAIRCHLENTVVDLGSVVTESGLKPITKAIKLNKEDDIDIICWAEKKSTKPLSKRIKLILRQFIKFNSKENRGGVPSFVVPQKHGSPKTKEERNPSLIVMPGKNNADEVKNFFRSAIKNKMTK